MRVLLLSGGLDSVAAFHQAKPDRAVFFSYGQPHQDAEQSAAAQLANRRCFPLDLLSLPHLARMDPTAGQTEAGVSRAFVPGRNALFLTSAAAFFSQFYIKELVLIMGANQDDAAAFPDCRPVFFDAAQTMLRAALAGVCDVHIETPWIAKTKTEILRWCLLASPAALRDARHSMSCYHGTRCGTCDACTLRTKAFRECRIADYA